MMNVNDRVKGFVRSVMSLSGYRNRRDYWVKDGRLVFRPMEKTPGRMVIALEEHFPELQFYWEKKNELVWF